MANGLLQLHATSMDRTLSKSSPRPLASALRLLAVENSSMRPFFSMYHYPLFGQMSRET